MTVVPASLASVGEGDTKGLPAKQRGNVMEKQTENRQPDTWQAPAVERISVREVTLHPGGVGNDGVGGGDGSAGS